MPSDEEKRRNQYGPTGHNWNAVPERGFAKCSLCGGFTNDQGLPVWCGPARVEIESRGDHIGVLRGAIKAYRSEIVSLRKRFWVLYAWDRFKARKR